MATYTVKQLARLSGVSVRTLHHYDEIGLLKPSFVGENRYRYYGREELLRLQDILFHRELGVPLQEIGKLLAREGRDRVAILSRHRQMLAERIASSRRLLETISKNARTSRLAPPTRAPSTSLCEARSPMFSGLTLPP